MKKKLVELVWHDIQSDAGWCDLKKETILRELKSYGLLVRRGKKVITLANCYDPETGKWSDPHDYPKGCIIRMRIIEEVTV